MQKFVFDTSAIIYASKVGLLRVCTENFHCIVSRPIYEEISRGLKETNSEHRQIKLSLEKFQVKEPEKKEVEKVKLIGRLTPEDLSAVALAKLENCALISDDYRVSKLAELVGVESFLTALFIVWLTNENILKKQSSIIALELLTRFGYPTEAVEFAKKVLGGE